MPSPYNGTINNFHVSRLGRKVAVDDQKVLIALPRDVVPERTWAEILQKEDAELVALELREEIVEAALRAGFERYMEKQTAPFAAHCAAQAWLKLIDWHFYRHDPGEDPTAYPPCFIPRRADSWVPDKMPEPSPKDSWARQNLTIVEEFVEGLKKAPSSESIDVPVVEEIPRESWFPGKVQLAGYTADSDYDYDSITYDETVSSDLAADSELLQKVTNYSPREDGSTMESANAQSAIGTAKGSPMTTESPTSLLHGAGDSNVPTTKSTKSPSTKSKLLTRSRGQLLGSGFGSGSVNGSPGTMESPPSRHGAGDALVRRSKSTKSKLLTWSSMVGRSNMLPPLASDSRSRVSVISDRRLRGLKLDTQYEIASEKIDTPPKVNAKRK